MNQIVNKPKQNSHHTN